MIAMTIAGFDPSGGAGVLSDIKTFHAQGVYGTAVITALTAQNVNRVEGVEAVATEFIEKQIDTLLEDYPIEYVKTGMLYSDEIVKLVSRKIRQYKLKLVVDPVMVSGSGGILSENGFAGSLKKYLLPSAILVTPNIFEAEQLSGVKITEEEDAVKAAIKIGKMCNVVVTGGHLNGHDIIYNGSINVIEGELVSSDNTHGTGCSYSAAVTCGLVKGWDLLRSVEMAGKFVRKGIEHGEWGTLNQFWKLNTQ
jgi:hydroxymethylpyrimidine/phosphomethylpyrimidine kinase